MVDMEIETLFWAYHRGCHVSVFPTSLTPASSRGVIVVDFLVPSRVLAPHAFCTPCCAKKRGFVSPVLCAACLPRYRGLPDSSAMLVALDRKTGGVGVSIWFMEHLPLDP